MVKPIVLACVALLVVGIAVVLVLAASRPDVFRVARTARIDAPPERVFALVNDLHEWGAWSPYERLDPDMARSYSGPESGPGAVYEWDGDGNVGVGRIEIREASPSKVALTLVMTRPFACRNAVEFTLAEEGGSTTVTWAMQGPAHFLSKLMGVFVDMDRMVGGQFEEGLANLKAVAEGKPATTGMAPESPPTAAAVVATP